MKITTFAAVGMFAGFLTTFAAEPLLKSGIYKSNFDPIVRPQDDLFRSVNGKWLKEATIPPDRPGYGTFFELRERSEKQVQSIIEAAAKTKDDPDAQKIIDFYVSFMDEARANKLGLTPIQSELDAIAAIKEKAELFRELAALQRAGVPGLFGIFVGTDAKKSDQYIASIEQGGLGLPNESYYRDPKYDSLRTSYVNYIGKMLALAKMPNPEKAAAQVMAIEAAIAKGHWENVQTRDVDKTYNKFSLSQLKALAKGLDLDVWFQGMGGKGIDELVVREPSFMTDLAKTIGLFSMEDWKTYLTWRLVNARAPMLSEPFVKENFEFYSKTLLGTPEIQPRWKRGVALVEGALGQAVGKLYVAKYFPPEAKEKMKGLVANLIEAYRIDIQALDWMSAETKAKALEKLAKFTSKIGYPDKWRDYSKLEIKRDDLVGNQRRISEFALNYRLGKLGKPVDRTEWGVTPQTVDAYYNPGMNRLAGAEVSQWKETRRIRRQLLVILLQNRLEDRQRIVTGLAAECMQRHQALCRVVGAAIGSIRVDGSGYIEESAAGLLP